MLQATGPAAAVRETLGSVKGVRALDVHDDHGRLTVDCRVDPREGVEADIAHAVAGRWALHHLDRQQPTLENVFLRYVSEPPAPRATP